MPKGNGGYRCEHACRLAKLHMLWEQQRDESLQTAVEKGRFKERAKPTDDLARLLGMDTSVGHLRVIFYLTDFVHLVID